MDNDQVPNMTTRYTAGCHATSFMDSVLTAEVAAAGSADDNDADGKAEEDNGMVGQWERT